MTRATRAQFRTSLRHRLEGRSHPLIVTIVGTDAPTNTLDLRDRACNDNEARRDHQQLHTALGHVETRIGDVAIGRLLVRHEQMPALFTQVGACNLVVWHANDAKLAFEKEGRLAAPKVWKPDGGPTPLRPGICGWYT